MVEEFGNDLAVIGQRNLDPEGENIVTGKLKFAEDHIPEGKLFARILGSPYAHARIVSIDTSAAEALDGVVAAITYQDNPQWSQELRAVEEEVAAVAAVDEATAERALDLIEVEYEVLPFVVDVQEAMQANAPLTGTFEEGNINPSVSRSSRGDIEQGFADADITVDETVDWMSPHTHNQIEPYSTVAWWDNDYKDVFCWTGSQANYFIRGAMAPALGVSAAHCHVFNHGTGGGFGVKNASSVVVPAALLAKKTGKPVALRLPRRQYTVHGSMQYGPKLQMKVGLKNDGTLTAIESVWYGDGGLNGGRSGWSDPDSSTWKCANYSTEQYGVATNKTPSGAWRCVAHPEGQYLSDIVLEKTLEALNAQSGLPALNPLEFRRKIFVTEDMPYQANGQPMDSFGVRKCMEKVAEAIGYEAKYHAPGTSTLPDGRLHGIGIHAHSDGHGGMFGGRGAIINMNSDGTVLFNSGGTRNPGGPGAQAQIIAETLGVTYDNVRVGDWGNTDTAADAGCQCGSTLTISVGAAFEVAAWDIRERLFAAAAGELGVDPEDLDARNNTVFVKADPSQSMTMQQVAQRTPGPIIGRGIRYGFTLRRPSPSVGDFPIGTPAAHKTGCASACEVAVDPETGDVEILNYAAAVDAGRVIDRISCEGQVLAGLAVQYSQAILFDMSYDPSTGRMLSFSHLDDKMSSSMCIPGPDKNHSFLIESIASVGPYGCIGIGEPSISSFASITNAVNNALGVFVEKIPYSPKTILEALGKV